MASSCIQLVTKGTDTAYGFSTKPGSPPPGRGHEWFPFLLPFISLYTVHINATFLPPSLVSISATLPGPVEADAANTDYLPVRMKIPG